MCCRAGHARRFAVRRRARCPRARRCARAPAAAYWWSRSVEQFQLEVMSVRTELRAHRRGVQEFVGFGQAVAAARLPAQIEAEFLQLTQRQSNGSGRDAQFARKRGAGMQACVREQTQQIEADGRHIMI